jgi:putative hydrolase of the HAD superfamily
VKAERHFQAVARPATTSVGRHARVPCYEAGCAADCMADIKRAAQSPRGMLWGILPSEASRLDIVVIFDGDDTLWSTEPLYDTARSLAREEVVRAGVDGDTWERLERQIDVDNVRLMGFSTERFPTSCVQAYQAACVATSRLADPGVTERVRRAARRVFDETPPLVAGAKEALRSLRNSGLKLALLTKGDLELQASRVERSGIADLFDVIRIVPEKLAETFRSIVAGEHAVAERCWSVGNSIRSDIAPAIESGMRAVWIDAHVWEHEQFDGTFLHDRVFIAASISEVPLLILKHLKDGDG